MTIALALFGASGKLGSCISALAHQDASFSLVATPSRQKRATDSLEKADVAIDVSVPEALLDHLLLAKNARCPLVIGSTGHDAKNKSAIETAAHDIPILYAPNFSLTISLCEQILSFLSHHLKDSHKVSIRETHHIHKKDSPSGTALLLAQATGLNPPIHSAREGETIGEHAICLESSYERLTISHSALSKDLFALGALRAARFLVDQPVGLYTMKDLCTGASL